MEFRAASHADYAALYPHRPRRAWRFAALQISAGSAWTLWQGGRPVAICGLFPLHSGIFEAWLMLARQIPAGAIRTILKRTAAIMPDTIIIARVDEENTAGQRLALMAGFVPVDEFLAGTQKRTWVRRTGLPVMVDQQAPPFVPSP